MNREAYGVDGDLEVEQARKRRKPAYEGIDPFKGLDLPDNLEFISRRATRREIDVPAFVVPKLAWPKVGLLVKDTLGLQAADMPAIKARFVELYPDGMPDDRLPSFIEEVRDGGIATQAQIG
jgi:hypothetical protein